MSAIPTSILDHPVTDAAQSGEAAPDSVFRRILGSGRVVIGGGVLLAIVLASLLTMPFTLRENSLFNKDQKSSLYFDRQVSELARTKPDIREPWRWFGTDGLGRGLFGRCLLGGTISLTIGVAAAAISVVLGVGVGLIAGYRGGWIDALLMRFVDVMYGLPYILLVVLFKIGLERQFTNGSWLPGSILGLAFAAIVAASLWLEGRRLTSGERWVAWGRTGLIAILALIIVSPRLGDVIVSTRDPFALHPSAANLVVLFLAIGLVSWLTMARVIRGQVLSLRNQPFVEACRASGLTEWRIFTRHLLPNLVGPITVYATLTVPQAILQESFLSFLGIGIQPPMPTWGSLASEGLTQALNTVNVRVWMLFFPCALLAATLLSLNFLGDGLRDVFDPKRDAAKI